jgi:O-antigen ligase
VTVAPLLAISLIDMKRGPLQWAVATALVLLLVAAVATRQRILLPLFFCEAAIGLWLLQRTGALRVGSRRLWIYAAVSVLLIAVTLAGLQRWRESTAAVRPVDQDARLLAWPRIAKRILEQPLMGSGLGRQAMRKAQPDLVPSSDPTFWHAHNVFLNAGISMGLPGVLALVFLFGALLACYAHLLRIPVPTARLVGIAGIAMIAGVIGRNLTNDFFVRDGALLFWALNGALLGLGTRLARAAPAETT